MTFGKPASMTTRRGFLTLSTSVAALLAGCAAESKTSQSAGAASSASTNSASDSSQSASPSTREQISDATNAGHAIAVSAETKSYKAVDVTKTGDADGDEADFYGTNAAVYAENGATLDLDDITVNCNGAHANAVFAYGEGTTVNIANSKIDTTSNCSGGIMVTGGGTLNASNLTIHTTGNSSASIRSDRGGGTQVVDGGSYTTDGTGSPVIYSTADVTVKNATLTSTASQGVVVEGKNSVALNNCELVASNTAKNSNKSEWYQAVMIYQSMSGDAAQGEANFSINGGSLTNKNGDVFFVNNTVATIGLGGAKITNEDASGVLLRAAAAGWGSEGNNGGHVTLTASGQELNGNMLVDSVSSLNLYLRDGSAFVGAINPDAAEGEVYVEVPDGASWELTGDAHITSLTCGTTGVKLNGHTLTVGESAYSEGTASTGSAIVVEVSSTGNGGPGGTPPDGEGGGQGGTPPDGGGQGGNGGTPPDGEGGGQGGNGGTPPEKPGSSSNSSK
ncbi:MAG: hypothetical protein Q4B54_11715 [Coriobacteriales bacterium]|nr:hypothetical protein [Coriobacteriales bacterium]